MPFQELADRADGQILSASYLNALSENVEWLWGAGRAANMPFQGYRNSSVASISATTYWYVRHRHRYVHYFVVVDDPLDYIRLKYTDGATVYTLYADETPGVTVSWNTYADTNSLGLTTSAWYKVYWEIAFASGSHGIAVNLIAECDATSFGTESAPSYSVPPTWARGDTVSHTEMNLYKTGLDSCRSQLGDEQWNVPVRLNNSEDRGYFLYHRHRWLHYIGDGEIVDPAGVGTNVDISGDGTDVQVYDLLNVDWLAEGSFYEIKDCSFAAEDILP